MRGRARTDLVTHGTLARAAGTVSPEVAAAAADTIETASMDTTDNLAIGTFVK